MDCSQSILSAFIYLEKYCSPPDSPVHRVLQARILEWVAIPFSRGSSAPRGWTQVSCIAGRFFAIWAIREAAKILSWLIFERQRPAWYRLSPLSPGSIDSEETHTVIVTLVPMRLAHRPRDPWPPVRFSFSLSWWALVDFFCLFYSVWKNIDHYSFKCIYLSRAPNMLRFFFSRQSLRCWSLLSLAPPSLYSFFNILRCCMFTFPKLSLRSVQLSFFSMAVLYSMEWKESTVVCSLASLMKASLLFPVACYLHRPCNILVHTFSFAFISV